MLNISDDGPVYDAFVTFVGFFCALLWLVSFIDYFPFESLLHFWIDSIDPSASGKSFVVIVVVRRRTVD